MATASVNIGSMDFLQTAVDAAKQGAYMLRQHWGKLEDVREKSHVGDLVTEADGASEEAVLERLQTAFPDHAVLCEESGLHQVENAEYLWAVDPLDGTTNYTHQLPLAAVSIALLHKGEPIVGVVYNPFMEELFSAVKGEGAILNGEKIRVSATSELSKSLLATGFAYDRQESADNNYREFCYLTGLTQGVRRLGSAALDLAFVAAGRYDGFWERGLNLWDIAAGALLVQEAGGRISSYENSSVDLNSGRILASNGPIHDAMSDKLIAASEQSPVTFGP